MPIVKVPIVHKFGIISHSQRLELQERLLREAYTKSYAGKQGFVSSKNPHEVNEEFVKKYNSIIDGESSAQSRQKIEEEAQKLLFRIRRRIGLKDAGRGNHVNVPLAWTELTLLAQCRGKVHQDCLDLLLLSLDQSACGQYQIPALFYLAEMVLYWLQTETTKQPYLRSAEIKLLKVGELVFLRLYYHKVAGHLSTQAEARQRLGIYMDGLEEHRALYEPFPNAALSFQTLIAIGYCIAEDETPHAETRELSVAEKMQSSSLMHELSPVLWHALDVWRCARSLGGELRKALLSLLRCAESLQGSNWVDSSVALSVLGDAAREDGDCLRALIALGRGETPAETPSVGKPAVEEAVQAAARMNLSVAVTGGGSGLPVLSDIHELSEGTVSPFNSTQMTLSKAGSNAPTHRSNQSAATATATATSPRWRWPQKASPQGLALWPWQSAILHTQLLTQISLHGATSGIRQMALSEVCALAELNPLAQDQEDLFWKLRFTALMGLVSICQAAQDDIKLECQKNVAWTKVIQIQRKQKDARVLEALKLGQIEGHLERLLTSSIPNSASCLANRIAAALSALYLAPAAPGVPVRQTKVRPVAAVETRKAVHAQTVSRTKSVEPKRTTLKEEIDLSTAGQQPQPDYPCRKNLDLRRVVEDQWRKDVQMLLEEEESSREKHLSEAQTAKEAVLVKMNGQREKKCRLTKN